MAKCFLDDGNERAGYAINVEGKKVPLCALHLIQMKQNGMEIVMLRGLPELPEVDKNEPHEWSRANLVGDNIWKCSRCGLEIKQLHAPANRSYGGCPGKQIEWDTYRIPTILKWRT